MKIFIYINLKMGNCLKGSSDYNSLIANEANTVEEIPRRAERTEESALPPLPASVIAALVSEKCRIFIISPYVYYWV